MPALLCLFVLMPGPAGANGITPPNPDPDVHILLSGPTSVNNAQEALTGQTITATLSVGGTINSIKWTVTGSVFKTWSETATPQKVALGDKDYSPTPPSAALTFNDATAESVTVSCTGTYTDLDGDTQPANPTPQTVTFLKPTATWYIYCGYMQEQSYQNSLYFNLLPRQTYGQAGDELGGGMAWEATITVPSPFSGGDGGFAQLIIPDRTYMTAGGQTKPVQGFMNNVQCLDSQFPYGGYQWDLPATGTSDDSPGYALYSGNDLIDQDTAKSVSMNDTFNTWLMYNPYLGQSIWVPLQTYGWQATETVTWSNVADDWYLSFASPSSSDENPMYSGATTDEYPTWSMTQPTGVKTQ